MELKKKLNLFLKKILSKKNKAPVKQSTAPRLTPTKRSSFFGGSKGSGTLPAERKRGEFGTITRADVKGLTQKVEEALSKSD